MLIWLGALVLVAGAAFLLAQTVPRLFPKKVGFNHFRKQLWKNGVDWRKLPRAGLLEFVDDALNYAKSVSTAERGEYQERVFFFPEYERMLRIHAFVVAALLQGKTAAQIEEAEKQKVEAKLYREILAGERYEALMRAGRAEHEKTMTAQAIDAEILRANLGQFGDFDEEQRIQDDVRTGKTWDRQRAILRRHGLLSDERAAE